MQLLDARGALSRGPPATSSVITHLAALTGGAGTWYEMTSDLEKNT